MVAAGQLRKDAQELAGHGDGGATPVGTGFVGSWLFCPAWFSCSSQHKVAQLMRRFPYSLNIRVLTPYYAKVSGANLFLRIRKGLAKKKKKSHMGYNQPLPIILLEGDTTK